MFEYDGKRLKGSELGRAYSGNNLAKTVAEQRDVVLAQRAALTVAVQQVGQFGAELEAFGQAYGAQRQADEKAAQQAQAQKDAKWAADMQELRDKRAAERAQAERAQAERDEKAAKQAAPPAEKPEKSANQALDPRLRPGYEAPTIKKDGGIER